MAVVSFFMHYSVAHVVLFAGVGLLALTEKEEVKD